MCAYICFDIADCISCELLITSGSRGHKHDPDSMTSLPVSVDWHWPWLLPLPSSPHSQSSIFYLEYELQVLALGRKKVMFPYNYKHFFFQYHIKQTQKKQTIPNVTKTSDCYWKLVALTFGTASQASLVLHQAAYDQKISLLGLSVCRSMHFFNNVSFIIN